MTSTEGGLLSAANCSPNRKKQSTLPACFAFYTCTNLEVYNHYPTVFMSGLGTDHTSWMDLSYQENRMENFRNMMERFRSLPDAETVQ